MGESKIETFIGFCIKSRKITFGGESISRLRGGVYGIIMCSTAQKNTQSMAFNFANVFNCPLIVCYNNLANVVHKDNCKVIAIRDRNLFEAIINNLNDNFKLEVSYGKKI